MDKSFTKQNTLIAKALAIILMFAHHLFNFPTRIDPEKWISVFKIHGVSVETIFGVDGIVCIAMFAFLSGYGMYKKYSSNKTANAINSMVFHQIKKLYIIYFQVFIIFVPLLILLTHYKTGFTELFLNLTGYQFTYNREWWFFAPYVLIMVLFPLFVKIVDNRWSKNYILVFFEIALINAFIYNILPLLVTLPALIVFGKTAFYQGLYTMLKMLLPAFLMGIAISKFEVFEKFRSLLRYNKVIVLLINIAVMAMAIWWRYKFGWDLQSDYFLAPILIITGVDIVKTLRLGKVFEFIGKHSTVMWLTHTFFCYYIFQNIVLLPKVSILIVLWLMVLTIATSIIIEQAFKLLFRFTRKIIASPKTKLKAPVYNFEEANIPK